MTAKVYHIERELEAKRLHTYITLSGEAELHILKLNTVFHQLPSVSPKQLCTLVHLGYTTKQILPITYIYQNSLK